MWMHKDEAFLKRLRPDTFKSWIQWEEEEMS